MEEVFIIVVMEIDMKENFLKMLEKEKEFGIMQMVGDYINFHPNEY